MPRERGQRRIAACWFCIPIGFFFLALAVPSFLFFRQHAGHSLGAAVALDFAARHRVERVVAIASFTTLREEAARVVGRELARLLRENYDNRENLSELPGTTRRRESESFMARLITIFPSRWAASSPVNFRLWNSLPSTVPAT